MVQRNEVSQAVTSFMFGYLDHQDQSIQLAYHDVAEAFMARFELEILGQEPQIAPTTKEDFAH